ncbi:MAG: nitrate reductase molybdenum cofactor assembly chaperone [Gammaproteobacteria bacterium]|nr:nitrate reductase molybdenum cofactor assembly chaperone [Gammaproteobacteria bacterium]
MSNTGRAHVLRALSCLLRYPTEEVVAASVEIRAAVDAEPALDAVCRAGLHDLIAAFDAVDKGAADLLDLQEAYVAQFDRAKSLSLHLFEHVHGESRDRGQAMIDLRNMYEQQGLALAVSELPDFLPVFLEYCGVLPRAEAVALLRQVAHIVAGLAQRLRARGSSYAAVLEAVCTLADMPIEPETTVNAGSAENDESDDFAALDRAWQEDPVVFGPDHGGCGGDRLIAKLRHGRRAAPQAPRRTAPGDGPDRHLTEGR